MQATEELIRSVVKQVLAEIKPQAGSKSGHAVDANQLHVGNGRSFAGRHGVFTCVDEAVAAADEAFDQLSEHGLEVRKRIIDHIRRISIDQCVELGTMEMEETKIGRLEHKIEKLKILGERTP